MLEINILSLVYTGIVALGLLSAQAALTKKNFVLTVSSNASLTAEGYSREVIEALFLNDIERVARTRSVIAAPSIHPVTQKNLVVAVADLLHMGELSLTVQEALGNPPHRVWANFVNESGKVHALVFGNSPHGDFQRVVAGKGDMRLLVRAAAHAAIRSADPYFMALHDFELGQNLLFVEKSADEELARQRVPLPPLQRAAFHNLKGLVRLEANDKEAALAAFDAAIEADPYFSIARVNRAFTLATLDRHPEAIATANEVLSSKKFARIEQVAVAARSVIGISKWAHGDHAGAEAEFAAAAREAPKNLAPLVYWSRLLKQSGRQDAAVEKLIASHMNEGATDDMYAEIAMLYYWIGGEDFPQRVKRRIQRNQARMNVIDAPGPAANPAVPPSPGPAKL